MTDSSLPDGIAEVEAEGGLPALSVRTQASEGLVYRHGAHVMAWTPAGAEPVLWQSGKSEYAPGKPIRGGVPVCFPWFGPGRTGAMAPPHGLARLVPWRLLAAAADHDGTALLRLELTAADVAGQPAADAFPADAVLRYDVRLGRSLELSLTVEAGGTALDFEEALHTYLTVGDVTKVRVRGLDSARYLDKTLAGTPERIQEGDVTFDGETDRVYFSAGAVTVDDPVLDRRILVEKSGSAATVVWNPWIAKAAAMPDYGNDEWPGMVCVEAANALDAAITLEPGESHTMRQQISIA